MKTKEPKLFKGDTIKFEDIFLEIDKMIYHKYCDGNKKNSRKARS